MKIINVTMAFLLCFMLFAKVSFAQEFDLGEYKMEVLQVVKKQSVSGQFLFKKEKFVGIKILLTPKNKKNDGLDLKDLVLKSGSKEYIVKSIRPYGFYSEPTSFVKLRKPKERAFYAIVEKDFTQGTFYYKGDRLFDVEVKSDSKIGTFNL